MLMTMPKLNIITWNYRGAANTRFHRAFENVIMKNNPDVVAILEPRVSGEIADKSIRKMHFDRSHRVQANGFEGGIWILWKSCFQLDILANDKQFIHISISAGMEHHILFTFVYASPNQSTRKYLWEKLLQWKNSVGNCLWGLAGDFNAILSIQDRKRGAASGNKPYEFFVKWF